jgi:hypothetical protein
MWNEFYDLNHEILKDAYELYPRRAGLPYKESWSERSAKLPFYTLYESIEAVEYAIKIVSLITPVSKE